MIRTEQYTVHGSEIDHTYHLKPYLVASLFQDAFARYSADLGFAAYDLQHHDRTWILSDMHMEFDGMTPFWREPYTIKTWVRKNQKVRMYVDFEAVNSLGKIFSRGSSCWLVLDENTREVVDAAEILNNFPVSDTEAIPDFRFILLQPEGELVNTEEQEVRTYDIDFNGHLNSVRYIAGGLEAIPRDIRLIHKLKSVTVRYIKEVYLGDVVRCEVRRVEHSSIIWIQLYNGMDEEVCRFKTDWELYPNQIL